MLGAGGGREGGVFILLFTPTQKSNIFQAILFY